MSQLELEVLPAESTAAGRQLDSEQPEVPVTVRSFKFKALIMMGPGRSFLNRRGKAVAVSLRGYLVVGNVLPGGSWRREDGREADRKLRSAYSEDRLQTPEHR
eukprot:3214498-Rhodomonas_salina.1